MKLKAPGMRRQHRNLRPIAFPVAEDDTRADFLEARDLKRNLGVDLIIAHEEQQRSVNRKRARAGRARVALPARPHSNPMSTFNRSVAEMHQPKALAIPLCKAL
jgi:hypothetical protein